MKPGEDESNASILKKPYDTPRLITYGNILELTQSASINNTSDGGGPLLTKTS